MPGLKGRIATTPDDRFQVDRLRYDVYVVERGADNLSGADHEARTLPDSMDDSGVIHLVEDGGQVLGSLRLNVSDATKFPEKFREIYRPEEFLHLCLEGRWAYSSRLIVAPEARGDWVFRSLVTAQFEYLLENRIRVLFLNCTPALVNMYERLGCRRYTRNFVDPDYGYRVPLVLLPGDRVRHEQVKSPFRPLLERYPSEVMPEATSEWFDDTFGLFETNEFLLSDESLWEFLNSRQSIPSLESIPVFDGMNKDEILEVIERSTIVHFAPEDSIVREGDYSEEMYLVLSGTVEARSSSGDVLSVLSAGQLFGEIGLIARDKRSASVFGVEEGQALVLTQNDLRKLMIGNAEIAAKLLLNLSRMLCERLVYKQSGRS